MVNNWVIAMGPLNGIYTYRSNFEKPQIFIEESKRSADYHRCNHGKRYR